MGAESSRNELGQSVFHRVVIAGLHREIDLTVTSGGDGIHQSVIAGLTDLECSVGNPFRFYLLR